MGKANDMVALRVEAVGPVAALYQLEDAERVARELAAEAQARNQHHTACGLLSAAALLHCQQLELVERFA